MSYKGYSNWATWNVNLWIMNDEGLYNEWRRRSIRYDWDEETVQEFIDEMFPNGTPDMDKPREMADVDCAELAALWAEEDE